jgi:hypothetical protein
MDLMSHKRAPSTAVNRFVKQGSRWLVMRQVDLVDYDQNLPNPSIAI